MNNNKQGGSLRPIVLLLFAVTVFCVVGLVAEGSKLPETQQNEEAGSAKVSDKIETETQTTIQNQVYLLSITGETTDKESSEKKNLAIVTEAKSGICGLSGSGITVEYSIEDGESRFILLRPATGNLGKIGSISKARAGMLPVINSFGSILLSSGIDSSQSIDTGTNDYLDLTKVGGAYYDNDGNTVTNSYLINTAIENSGILTQNENANFPYQIVSESQITKGSQVAKTIQIPFSDTNKTEFTYQSNGEYQISKNMEPLLDGLDSTATYVTNVLILFCDAVTYESADSTETVLKTTSSGFGYFANGGSVSKILWNCTSDGSLRFYTQKGEELCVGLGNTYISFIKSSKKNAIKFY